MVNLIVSGLQFLAVKDHGKSMVFYWTLACESSDDPKLWSWANGDLDDQCQGQLKEEMRLYIFSVMGKRLGKLDRTSLDRSGLLRQYWFSLHPP